MADIFYVSQQHGSNDNDGLSAANAKATLAGLQAVMDGDGDVAYIGPGTYRERYVVQNVNQTFQADPLCKYLTNDVPGRVRITGCGENEISTSGIIVDLNAKTGCKLLGYSLDHLLLIDGASDTYSINGAADTIVNYVSVGKSYYGISNSVCSFCACSTVARSFYDSDTTLCLGVGAGNLFQIAGTSVAKTAINCIALGGVYGFINTGTGAIYTVKNSVAIAGGTTGAYSGEARGMTLTKCLAIHSLNCFYGRSTSYPLVIGDCYVAGYTSLQRGGGYEDGTPTEVAELLWDWSALLRAFEPIIYAGIAGLGTATGAPTTDILGRLLTATPPIGPHYPTDSNSRQGYSRRVQ